MLSRHDMFATYDQFPPEMRQLIIDSIASAERMIADRIEDMVVHESEDFDPAVYNNLTVLYDYAVTSLASMLDPVYGDSNCINLAMRTAIQEVIRHAVSFTIDFSKVAQP